MVRKALFECYCPVCKDNILHQVGVVNVGKKKYVATICSKCQKQTIFNSEIIENLVRELTMYIQLMETIEPSQKH